jgi:hypothetical protein
VDAAAGLEAFPTQQITQRAGGGRVAAFGERAAPLQHRHGGHGEPIKPPREALADSEEREQLCIGGTGPCRQGKRVNRLGEEAVRGGDRAVGRATDSTRTDVRFLAFCRR